MNGGEAGEGLAAQSFVRRPPPFLSTHEAGAERRHATFPQCIKGISLPLTHTRETDKEKRGAGKMKSGENGAVGWGWWW